MSNEIVNFTPKSGGFAAATKDTKQQSSRPRVEGGTDLLKLGKETGKWVFGQKNEPLGNAVIAVNMNSMSNGFVDWKGGKPVGEKMAVVGQEPVNEADLPPAQGKKGWEVQIGFEGKIVDGEHAGTDIKYKSNARGGIELWNELFDAAEVRAAAGKAYHPVVDFGSDSYVHEEWGKVYTPDIEIVDWMDDEGNMGDDAKGRAQVAAPAEEPAEEPEPEVAEAEDVSEPEEETTAPSRRRRRRA